ncbi:hypothetical protein J0H58_03555 [bacterium]|nr:hypothetical protein [bacterium]
MKSILYVAAGTVVGGVAGLVLLYSLMHFGAFGDIVWPHAILFWVAIFLLLGLVFGTVGGLIAEWLFIGRREENETPK